MVLGHGLSFDFKLDSLLPLESINQAPSANEMWNEKLKRALYLSPNAAMDYRRN
jgi:hypothetical protein